MTGRARRLAGLAAALCAALPALTHAQPRTAPGGLAAPVRPACITSPFGPRARIGPQAPAGMHDGVDLRAPAGGAVYAVAPGEVLSIRRRGPGGLEVTIRHPGFIAIYAHLGRVTPALAEGRRRVAAGTPIGVVGHSGVTYGMHLYFEVLVGGRPVDPAPLLGVSACRPRP
ncbi:MAG: M23 family metallopeptidase [Rhodospirillales bacterium]|nr:M23 family metallopeptidase [Rhodospirillales bacterium]MDE2573894.1 M23 family metallopeptidase [Rhodospirillales bacterium]